MRQLVISESKWYRGKGDIASRLCRISDGMMCCLGFEAIANGLKPENIMNISFPSDIGSNRDEPEGYIPAALPDSMKWLLEDPTADHQSFERTIGGVNDDISISDDERKATLRPLFAHGNVELVFVP